jgi:hypothetical protein
VVFKRSLRESAVRVAPVLCEPFDRMFGVIVVPRHTVVFEKCEKPLPVLCESALIFYRTFGRNKFVARRTKEVGSLLSVLI